MATTVTLTIADADAPRIVAAATNPNQIVAGAAPLFPATGATNAAILKDYATKLLQQATLIHEAANGGPAVASGVVPAIT